MGSKKFGHAIHPLVRGPVVLGALAVVDDRVSQRVAVDGIPHTLQAQAGWVGGWLQPWARDKQHSAGRKPTQQHSAG